MRQGRRNISDARGKENRTYDARSRETGGYAMQEARNHENVQRKNQGIEEVWCQRLGNRRTCDARGKKTGGCALPGARK
jgi:hypothetical protein